MAFTLCPEASFNLVSVLSAVLKSTILSGLSGEMFLIIITGIFTGYGVAHDWKSPEKNCWQQE